MDGGSYPNWLVEDTFERRAVCEMIDRVFEIDSKDKALQFIDDNTQTLDESSRYKRCCW